MSTLNSSVEGSEVVSTAQMVPTTPAQANEPRKMHNQYTMYSIKFSGTIEPTPPPSWIIATYSPAIHTSPW